MKVHADISAVKRSRWYELVARFFFGAVITVLTGIIAKECGPAIAGLFLAFPAIFPASATLLEKHEKENRQRAGIDGTKRARTIAGVDAAGTAMGCIGLGIFAVIVWQFLPGNSAILVIGGATLAWLMVAIGVWLVCDRARLLRKLRRRHPVPVRR